MNAINITDFRQLRESEVEEPATGSCKLVAGIFALFLQTLVAAVGLCVLIYKRLSETPKRTLSVWLMDVSKQATGGIFIHLWNIVLSILFAQTLAESSDTSDQSDECAFYFLMFLFDTIFGVSFIWILLRLMKAIAESFGIESIKVQGYYGNPPSINWYLQQQLSFVIAIIGSKSIISTIMYVEALPLQHIGNRIFQSLQMNPRCELIVVMIICPFFFNIIQYWIIDNFLSKNADATSVSETEVYELIH